MPSPIKIQVEVSDDGAVQGLKVISKGVDDFVAETKLKLNAPVSEAGGIGSYVDHLSEKLREHGKEHMQTARAVGRFTKELEGLAGKGNEVAGALGALAGGFAMGGVLGLGIEAVKVLAERFGGLSEEEKKAKGELEEWFKALDTDHAKAVATIQDLQDKINKVTPIQAIAREKFGVDTQIREFGEELTKQNKIVADFKALGLADAILEDNKEYKAAAGEVAGLTRQIDALRQKSNDLNTQGHQLFTVSGQEQRDADSKAAGERRQKEAAERARAAEQARREAEASQRRAVEDALRVGREAETRKNADRAKSRAEEERSERELADQVFYLRQAGWNKERADQLKSLDEWKIQELNWNAAKYQEDGINEERATREFEERKLAIRRQYNERRQQIMEPALSKLQQAEFNVIASVEAQWQRGVAAMLRGHMTLAQGLSGIWNMIEGLVVDAIARMLTTWLAAQVMQLVSSKATKASIILDDAEEAAAATYASVSEIPYVGPFLAPPAAAAAFAAVMAFDSAEGGWNIPMGLNPVTQLHQGEHVLPKEIAQRYESGAPGRSSSTSISIRAFDSRDVVATLNDLKRKGRLR